LVGKKKIDDWGRNAVKKHTRIYGTNSVSYMGSSCEVALIAANGLQLTEGREFNQKTTMEARNLNIPQNFLRSSKPLLLVRCS
jgi:hypothetical protein